MAERLAIHARTVHRGDGGAPLRDVRIDCEDGLIVAIGATSAFEAPVIEAEVVVPGLINAHVHLEMSGEAKTLLPFLELTPTQRALVAAVNARKTIEAGVTTVRDVGATEANVIHVRDEVNAGRLPGPRILAAGKAICMTGGHGWWVGREADGPLDVMKAVREQRKLGADCIKLIATGGVLTKGAVPGIAQLQEDEMRAAVEEAHRHGLRVAAHAIGTEGIKNALRAGVDSIEHGHLVDNEALQLFLDHGAYSVPTLAAVTCIVEGGEEAGMPDFVLRKARELLDKMNENIRKLYKFGVPIAAGADSGTPFNFHENFAYELELMERVLGMTPREVLRAATTVGAELLNVNTGRLEPGRAADLVVLGRDIDGGISAVRDVRVVIKGGKIAHRAAA